MAARVIPFLAVALLCVAPTVHADLPAGYDFVSYDEGLRLAGQQQKRLFVYFGRHGCSWCEQTNREALSNPDLKKQLIEHYILVYIDTEGGRRATLPSGERVTEMELSARFKVFATPMFAYLEPDGRLILKVAGVQTAVDFEQYDRFVHGGVYRSKSFPQFMADEQRP